MSVRVVSRIRPLLEKERESDIIVRADTVDPSKPNTVVKIPNPKNEAEEFSFTFNGVYDRATTQEELFTAEVAPYVKSLFQGFDVTIFAYGVTGTGKTHTMRGGMKLADRGVIPRMLSSVFRRGKKIMKDSKGDTDVKVLLSYYEIYNDKVFDLLEPPEKRTPTGLPLRAEANGKTIVVGLSERACEDLKDFEKLYIEANNNRVTAATKLNAHSSRSHAILRVKLIQTTAESVKESTASAIDLAGSEDNRRTDNGKERLVESAAINKSLFVLSQCIDAIGRGDKRIPYRESKMTRILSLGQNNGITVMILNLSPLRGYHLDTLSSLNVSSRAKRIEVREIENEIVYKSVPRTNSGLSGLGLRQPLRPLANLTNVHNGNVAAKDKAAEKAADKPVKAFSVYTDKSKPAAPVNRPLVSSNLARPRTNPVKRPSENEAALRPSKISKPTAPASITVSAAQIEAMVEKKVSEILAARIADEQKSQPPPTVQPEISDAVQRRLEALEKRIDSDEWRDDSKSEGLRFLLAARQHKERGEDQIALNMYERALPFFPGQAKLLNKIERLRSRLDGKVHAASPRRATPRSERKRRKFVYDDADGDYETAEADVEEDELAHKALKSKSRRAKPLATKSILSGDDEGPASPRTQHLLDIVNSRDPDQIRSLVGFGAKKARDLVDYLDLVSNDEAGGHIDSLSQLRTVPGMGGRTIERAYDGLVV
ncbi:hypothetical protein NW768_003539 [Fusarium equiseti]|uniref:Kinesin motor domain-containing protein n=1 Tax=Fusarium equiseti TaxID=61235 RepID=A0ABQ8RHY0_FUSEQ|nr:hypothetical protein NW768_003539 [Fusarium equiseti]